MHKYELIAHEIRKKIIEGEYPINSQLPYEKDIMEKYEVSRITAKRAYDMPKDEHGNFIMPAQVGMHTILSLGTVIYDRPNFHSERYIWPVGYCAQR